MAAGVRVPASVGAPERAGGRGRQSQRRSQLFLVPGGVDDPGVVGVEGHHGPGVAPWFPAGVPVRGEGRPGGVHRPGELARRGVADPYPAVGGVERVEDEPEFQGVAGAPMRATRTRRRTSCPASRPGRTYVGEAVEWGTQQSVGGHGTEDLAG